MPDPEVLVFPDAAQLAAAGADRVVRACRETVAARGECAIALSGGETPRLLYERLAAEPRRSTIPWDRVQVFWGDERCVPPDDPRSNFRMARETLLDRVPVVPAHAHRMPGDRADLDRAARDYADELRRHVPQTPDGWPRFDLVLLGLGEDAHTASLFPGTPVLRETARAVVAYRVPGQDIARMTLTPPALNHAREIVFLVSGERKAGALRSVVAGPRRPEQIPAQLIEALAGGRVVWLVDRAAASALPSRAVRAAQVGEGAG